MLALHGITILAQLSRYTEPSFWIGLAGLTGLVLVFVFVAALVEKRPTSPYGAATAPGTQIDSYHVVMNAAAAASGFRYGGTFRHRDYPVNTSLWRSADRLILMLTGAGSVMGQSQRRTALYTRLADGRVLITCDDYGEGDASGLWAMAYHKRGSLDDLLAMHRRRLEAAGVPPHAFGDASALDAYHALCAERAARLVACGTARWAGRDRSAWRYTVSGATACWGQFFPQLFNGVATFWRKYRPRAGVLLLDQPLDPSLYPSETSDADAAATPAAPRTR